MELNGIDLGQHVHLSQVLPSVQFHIAILPCHAGAALITEQLYKTQHFKGTHTVSKTHCK